MTQSASAEYAAVVGVDLADRKRDICLQAGRDGECEYLVLEHRPEAIDDWANALRQPSGGGVPGIARGRRGADRLGPSP